MAHAGPGPGHAGAMVVADHCMSLYELAALYLSPDPPQLADAQVAIDSLAALIDAVGPRFGPNEKPLRKPSPNSAWPS